MKNKGGFTLIEILVVLLIIGITLGFALLAFGDFGSERRIIIAAEQFVNYVKFIQQEAILETGTLGIRFEKNNYQVLRFQPPKNWGPMPAKTVFRLQHFPSNAIIHIENGPRKIGDPQIIINAAGDMTAFRLTLGSNKQTNIAEVVVENGTIALQLLNKP